MGAAVGELRGRARSARRRVGGRLPRARGALRDRSQRTRVRAPGQPLQHALAVGSRGASRTNTASSCRPTRSGSSTASARATTSASSTRRRAHRWADLLGEPDAAGSLGGLPGGPQIWVAPTADDSDGWLASMRHIAIESGAFVVSVPQYIPRSAFRDDFPRGAARRRGVRPRRCRDHRAERRRGDRGTAVRRGGDRRGRLRPARGLHAKRWFDAAGHYSRSDVLAAAVRPAPAGPLPSE